MSEYDRTETEIAERAFAQADKLGLKLKAVKVQDAGRMHGALGVAYLAGLVRVSRRAARELSDKELDFALTYAMAITPGIMTGFMLLIAVVCFTVIILVGNALGIPLWISIFLSFVTTSIAVTVTARANLANEQRQRFKKALKVTNDPESAKSYIEKLADAQAKVLPAKMAQQMKENVLSALEERNPKA